MTAAGDLQPQTADCQAVGVRWRWRRDGRAAANGAVFAPSSDGLSFTVSAGLSAPVNNSGIHLSLNGADVTSGLSFSGSGPINVNYLHLVSNTIYTAVIGVTNTAGAGTSRTIAFDTMDPNNFHVKLEDVDYNGGGWNTTGNGLAPFGYYQNSLAVSNVDYHHTSGGAYPFRAPGLATEVTVDVALPGYFVGSDYDVGNFNNGDWGNYTRDYPAGKYMVYGRLAGFGLVAYLDKLTGGLGTQNQTTQRLGTWQANPNGWQNWAWVPLTDAGLAAPVFVTLGGTNTLRVTSGGNVNANYFMLVPVQGIEVSAAKLGTNIVISFPTQAGASYRVFSNTILTGGNWSLVATVPGDGTVRSAKDPATASLRFYKVTSP